MVRAYLSEENVRAEVPQVELEATGGAVKSDFGPDGSVWMNSAVASHDDGSEPLVGSHVQREMCTRRGIQKKSPSI